MKTILILAGGTGGHVFPALATAQVMAERGWQVHWMGAESSFEERLIPQHQIPFHAIKAYRLRGQSRRDRFLAPWRLLRAIGQAIKIIRMIKPQVVLGMGGFTAAPGGIASRLLGIPLVIHEQNRIPGLTNRLLAKIATQVLQAFNHSFAPSVEAITTGNPVRQAILQVPPPQQRWAERDPNRPLRILVLGGSLGAEALNKQIPPLLAACQIPLEIRHQSGKDKLPLAKAAYQRYGLQAEVVDYIEDMAAAYAWADWVICRAGALTIAELAAVGVGAALIPYPYAVDDHQTANADFLVHVGAAILIPQNQLQEQGERLCFWLHRPDKLFKMAQIARHLARPDAADQVADYCERAALEVD